MASKVSIFLGALALLPAVAFSQTLRIASWNLGWHVSTPEISQWIETCSRSFKQNPNTKRWDDVPHGTPDAIAGWQVTGNRPKLEGVDLAKMPPCSVYQDARFKGIAVTPPAYANRMRQLVSLMDTAVKPDIIAFQEVSGTAAVREALGAAANDFNVCSFDGQYKVQRLAFAWRKSLGEATEPCKAIDPVSLPQEPVEDQVRPALTLGLRLGDRTVRFMNVHLKSSCVSSLEKDRLDDVKNGDCARIQKQLRPLETAVESLAAGAAQFVVLGDFNRNLWHEFSHVTGSEPVRTDGESDLTKPLATDAASRNLFREVFDGAPGGAVSLIPLRCAQDAATQALCDAAKSRVLTGAEKKTLTSFAALGCKFPIGLDHFVVSKGLEKSVVSAEKIPLGKFGGSKSPVPGKPEPLLAVSDHCPIVLSLQL